MKSFFYYYSSYPANPKAKTDQPIAEKSEAVSTCSKKSKGGEFKSSILKDDASA